jgi:hypothetical protein
MTVANPMLNTAPFCAKVIRALRSESQQRGDRKRSRLTEANIYVRIK